MKRLCLAFLLILSAAPAFAFTADDPMDDPAQEARARELARELRCVVCQNQSIFDSNADLARDLRVLVRERIAAGDTDAEAKQYIVDRYGDFVLLKPPFKVSTYALWLGPVVIFLLGAAAVYFYHRRRRTDPEVATLSAEERRRLDKLLLDDS
ncbi:MAG: cytochrome C biogenesis protein CcmH [Rhodospirillaceae bacterium]|nr:cytochrome C biogenesis protein CcmH [Rhodospirillaceae bacterium]